MLELRKDYILDRWALISEKRGARPKQFKKDNIVKDDKFCYFCQGNENTTPPEIGRVEGKKGWQMRWFHNKFPAVDKKGSTKITKKGILESTAAYGEHIVLVETSDHTKQLSDLPEQDIEQVLRIYTDLIINLSKNKKTSYVIVFKNHGPEGGTSIVHTHTQIASVPVMPQIVRDEIKENKKGAKCRLCKVIEAEKKASRKILETKNAIAIAPYASRFNYEAWIFPKRHIKSITDFNEGEYKDFAKILKKLLVKLSSIDASYNFFLHYSPKQDFHFHIELIPRIATWAGFEHCSGIVINSVSPEMAAKFYRE